jgi:hypothetical protein
MKDLHGYSMLILFALLNLFNFYFIIKKISRFAFLIFVVLRKICVNKIKLIMKRIKDWIKFYFESESNEEFKTIIG